MVKSLKEIRKLINWKVKKYMKNMKNGNTYEGDFKKGLSNGKGTKHYYDGKIKKGNRKNEKYIGEYKFHFYNIYF